MINLNLDAPEQLVDELRTDKLPVTFEQLSVAGRKLQRGRHDPSGNLGELVAVIWMAEQVDRNMTESSKVGPGCLVAEVGVPGDNDPAWIRRPLSPVV